MKRKIFSKEIIKFLWLFLILTCLTACDVETEGREKETETYSTVLETETQEETVSIVEEETLIEDGSGTEESTIEESLVEEIVTTECITEALQEIPKQEQKVIEESQLTQTEQEVTLPTSVQSEQIVVEEPPAPELTIQEAAPVVASDIMVWQSETGSKYHSINNCGRMNPSKAIQITETEAINKGLGPCSKCW